MNLEQMEGAPNAISEEQKSEILENFSMIVTHPEMLDDAIEEIKKLTPEDQKAARKNVGDFLFRESVLTNSDERNQAILEKLSSALSPDVMEEAKASTLYKIAENDIAHDFSLSTLQKAKNNLDLNNEKFGEMLQKAKDVFVGDVNKRKENDIETLKNIYNARIGQAATEYDKNMLQTKLSEKILDEENLYHDIVEMVSSSFDEKIAQIMKRLEN